VEDTHLDPVAHLGLVHELAVAIDDQRFELARAEPLLDACREEAWMGALGVAEGSAGFFATQVALRTFSPAEQAILEPDRLYPRPAGVPPFVHALQVWPFVEGPRFASVITDLGETEGINEPLSTFPVSTEQVMHPADRLDDAPVAVDVPDLGPAIGAGWRDLDLMDVGEEWIDAMLTLRLDANRASSAALGWGGGRYRAWTDATNAAVLLITTWDTPRDAGQFLAAARRWIGEGSGQSAAAGMAGDPTTVVAMFATNPTTLAAMEDALR
jgi:hypothetical protein